VAFVVLVVLEVLVGVLTLVIVPVGLVGVGLGLVVLVVVGLGVNLVGLEVLLVVVTVGATTCDIIEIESVGGFGFELNLVVLFLKDMIRIMLLLFFFLLLRDQN